MKKYTFEIVIKEGSDEYWENMKGTGCDEIKEDITRSLMYGGFQDAEVRLRKYEEE